MNQVTSNNKQANLSKEVFWKYMLIAQDMTNKTLLNETSKFYYQSLIHLSNEDYITAIEKTLRQKKYPSMPMIGDILSNVPETKITHDISKMRFTSKQKFDNWNITQSNKYEFLDDGYIREVK